MQGGFDAKGFFGARREKISVSYARRNIAPMLLHKTQRSVTEALPVLVGSGTAAAVSKELRGSYAPTTATLPNF